MADMKILLCVFILYIHTCYAKVPELLNKDQQKAARKILSLSEDIVKDTNRRINLLLTEQKAASHCAPFEVGYLTYVIHEKYRRMVDKYNVSRYMTRRLYMSELVLYLDEIERHYWEITHISNMLHEVERKYRIEPDMSAEYKDTTPESHMPAWNSEEYEPSTRHHKRKTRFKYDKYLQKGLTSTKWSRGKRGRWPLEYGWEPKNWYW